MIYLICCLAGPSTLKLSQICSFLLMFHLVMDGSVIGKGQRNIPPDLGSEEHPTRLGHGCNCCSAQHDKTEAVFSYDPSSEGQASIARDNGYSQQVKVLC